MNGETTDEIRMTPEAPEAQNTPDAAPAAENIPNVPYTPAPNVPPVPPFGTPVSGVTPPQKKPYRFFPIDKRDLVFALAGLFLCLIGTSLTLWGGFQIGFTVTFLLLFTLGSVCLWEKDTPKSPYGLLCGLTAVAASFVFAFTANTAVRFLTLCVLFVLTAIWFASISGAYQKMTDGTSFLSAFAVTFSFGFGQIGRSMGSLLRKQPGRSSTAGKVLLGAAISLPLLAIVITLLTTADAAFEGLLDTLSVDFGDMIGRVIVGLTFVPLLMGYYFGLKKKERVPAEMKEPSLIDPVLVISFLAMLSLVYLVYLFSQLAYFVSAFANILPKDYLPAEYARRGFFELCTIAAINVGVVLLAQFLSRKKEGKVNLAVRLESAFICLFSLGLIASACAKMILYIRRFGLTVLRVGTMTFMLLLAVIFVTLLIRCFLGKAPIFRVAVVTAAVLLMVLAFGDMNTRIAEYNVWAYQTGKLSTVDVDAIADMGWSGAESLVKLTEDSDRDVRQEAITMLKDLIRDSYKPVEDDESGAITFADSELGSWSLSRARGDRALRDWMENSGYTPYKYK